MYVAALWRRARRSVELKLKLTKYACVRWDSRYDDLNSIR